MDLEAATSPVHMGDIKTRVGRGGIKNTTKHGFPEYLGNGRQEEWTGVERFFRHSFNGQPACFLFIAGRATCKWGKSSAGDLYNWVTVNQSKSDTETAYLVVVLFEWEKLWQAKRWQSCSTHFPNFPNQIFKTTNKMFFMSITAGSTSLLNSDLSVTQVVMTRGSVMWLPLPIRAAVMEQKQEVAGCRCLSHVTLCRQSVPIYSIWRKRLTTAEPRLELELLQVNFRIVWQMGFFC